MDKIFTVCFSGTSCTRDEGEVSRAGSDKRIYSTETGYIPVRIHKEISGNLRATDPSVTVRGVGVNDWAEEKISEKLSLHTPLEIPKSLKSDTERFSGGDQRSIVKTITGTASAALALHGANLAAASGAKAYNFIGHSRGAMQCMMAAWFLYVYGGDQKNIPVRIFAIDPVPGYGEWYSIITNLAPNVANYVGVTAWDHLDYGFSGLVPRPNAKMAGSTASPKLDKNLEWTKLADEYDLANPLKRPKGNISQPTDYRLFACRGRHGTVAGNTTSDGLYDPAKVDTSVARVPQLVYKMARAYLTEWGTVFRENSAVDSSALELRRMINLDHGALDNMGGGKRRDSAIPGSDLRRYVSSSRGRVPTRKQTLESVAGNPPYRQPYPVTDNRTGAGWVNWTYL